MNQTTELLDALKRELRAHSITYAEVASTLDLSEASVKRLFSEQSFSLHRLEQVCDLVGLTFIELAERARNNPNPITELTREQEKEFVGDTRLLLVAVLVLNGWLFEEITERYDFTDPQLIRYLARLDKMKMIDLLPGNRVRRLVSRNFSWRAHGPVQKFFEQHIRDEFFDSHFSTPGEHLRLASGLLSPDSLKRLHARMDTLVKEMDQIVQADADLPIDARDGASMVLAIRPWEPAVFSQYRRKG